MIDIEVQVYNEIATRLRTEFPGIYLSGDLNLNPASFPCAYIEQADNSALTTTRDTSSNENHVSVMFEVNAFSNKAIGRKSEVKAIMSVVDETFNNMGFTRQTLLPMPYEEYYRMVGRWVAIADKNHTIYRR